ncbi:PREDICTED: alpha-tectorin-like [Nicrophorus vespilloides]|uniref:Alpha-tectorin-like n=1 Tax=Nicrophorus vespilloides TaxID=110193 RepID=A0ABM1NJI4_NICVS|nr:PREDICTED: alpha-tectorin-like [Nicrophorus vespilloides]
MKLLTAIFSLICVSCAIACPEFSEYVCGTKCPKSCDNLHIMIKCISGCDYGCFCKEGYVFDKNGSDKCVPTESCYSYCDREKHETYYDTVLCECSDPKDFKTCAKCVPGCFCIHGYKRNDQGVCVQEE